MSTKSAQGNPLAIVAQQIDGVTEDFKSLGGKVCSGVREAASATAMAVGKGAYKTAYGVAYGLVSTGTFVNGLLCEKSPIRKGFVDGAGSALGAKKPAKRTPAKKTPAKKAGTLKAKTPARAAKSATTSRTKS